LGANYPGTIWYERAYKLIERNGDVREKREKRQKPPKKA
ncbi:MAG: outer membrane protein assembly factor BamD, partial [Sphingomonas sp.]|nr:outer membrane protein assembly factor BamD [Sphingomonas sp.]